MLIEEKTLLNQGQQAAADGFFQFLFSADKEMILSGPGGVGKTYLMGYLIDKVMPRYFQTCRMMGIEPEYDNVEMCATTNKAAEVLALATGRPTKTIHSFLNLKVANDYDTGRSKLTRTGAWVVHTRKIIFVDECSTEDPALILLLSEGTHKCKIIHVGDHCQLGPVGYVSSPLYSMNLPFFELTEPMRNADQPALMAICQQLRDTVETGIFKPIQVVPGVIDWADDEEMQQAVDQTFQQQTRTNRILAYTNHRVNEYNEHIRGLRNLPAEFQVGELLVNSQAIKIGKSMLSVEAEVEILSQHSATEKINIAPNVELEIRRMTFQSRLGIPFHDVPVPVDRAHYASLVRYYGQKKNWGRLYHLKDTYPDLRPLDAATVHKAQGSTYNTVFVDLGNISTCHQQHMVARMLYVAFSRARNRVIMYGDLAQKYGGLIQ
jgi:hypothetical protein